MKNIIFDLGNVILNIDFNKTINAFKNIGITDAENIYNIYKQHDFFDQFEKGLISPQDFRDNIKKISPNPLSDKMIDEAWGQMILDIPIERVNLLISLKNHYRLFLLSNTNQIHFDVYNADFVKKYGIPCFSDLFEKAYYSFRCGLRKPDAELFKLVLSENDLTPAETLYIDDLTHHIKTADSLGIQTLLLQSPDLLSSSLFEKLNEKF